MNKDFDKLVGKTITQARRDFLGWWWTLDNQVVNPPCGRYVFRRVGHFPNQVEIWTENNVVTKVRTGLVF